MESSFIIGIAVIILIIIILISVFSKKAIIKRKLKNTPSESIAEYKDGEINKIVGTARCINEPLVAPLSSRKCVFYMVKVEKKVQSGKNSHWKKIIEEEVYDNFKIVDDSGEAIVKPEYNETYLVFDARYRSGFLQEATDNLIEYLNHHGHDSIGFMGFNKEIRYQEAVLELNEELAVAGTGNWIENDNGEKELVISGNVESPLYISDDPSTLSFVEAKTEKDRKTSLKKLEERERKRSKKRESRYVKSYK